MTLIKKANPAMVIAIVTLGETGSAQDALDRDDKEAAAVQLG